MFFTNVFSFAHRQRLAEHAYRRTRADLRAHRVEVAALLDRHGLRLRNDVLDDDSRTLVGALPGAAGSTSATRSLHSTLDHLDQALKAKRKPARRARTTRREAAPQ